MLLGGAEIRIESADIVCFVAVLLSALLLSFAGLFSSKQPSPKPKQPERPTRAAVVCPFSKQSKFEVECADDRLPLSPLELYEQQTTSSSSPVDRQSIPPAARWLNAGCSGQDTPGMLRAGLKRLRNSRHFLVQDKVRQHAFELELKQHAFDTRHDEVFVAEPDSLEAQRECLELFLDYLPKRYPVLYHYDATADTITVSSTATTFQVQAWYDSRPLELCARLVQEDLVLMRPPPPPPRGCRSATHTSYRMAAAAVVFSFDELPDKLGQESQFIHAPVPGFQKHVLKAVNLLFHKLTDRQIWWRNNWGIAPNGLLDQPARPPSNASNASCLTAYTFATQRWLEVEYQTLRRLPRTRHVLFTVKTLMDRMDELRNVPKAAACLAASIRGMAKVTNSDELLRYKGIENKEMLAVVLNYLDSISLSS